MSAGALADEGGPLFLRIAQQIENAIIDGSLPEEAQVPSTNELAAFHRINPATAAKGVSQLVTDGLLYKKRGIGMFVTTGARARIRRRRRDDFERQFVEPIVAEAHSLGIGLDELKSMIDQRKEQP